MAFPSNSQRRNDSEGVGNHDVVMQDEEHQQQPATLISNPRNLATLWREYMEGIGGRKAAKDFNASDRGRVKRVYHFRKVVWDTISSLVRAGDTVEVAIDKIYGAYGQNLSVTKITRCLLRDQRNGGHPSLRV